jgi:predicted transcriptional regulator
MGFELTVVSNIPLTEEEDLEHAAKIFLAQIGYLSKGADVRIPLNLFMECLLKKPEKAWQVDELAVVLKTSRPTVYRHLNKLKSLDLLEEVLVEDEQTGQLKKGYKLRYGSLSKAWNFVEAHVKVALENYRKTVNHIQELIDKRMEK